MGSKTQGDSPLSRYDYTIFTFIHYYQQIHHCIKLKPIRVLEIGPGDHTVTDFLRRHGIAVRTLDNDPRLHPDYVGDIRKELPIDEKFDLVLASEVLEHTNIRYLETILENIKRVMATDAYLVVSIPYTTIRLFPGRSKYGRIISCEGRIYTHIPYFFLQWVRPFIRGIYRIVMKRQVRGAFEIGIPEFPDDRYDVHHWDLGFWPTTRGRVRNILKKRFTIVEEKAYVDTNCVFFVMKRGRP